MFERFCAGQSIRSRMTGNAMHKSMKPLQDLFRRFFGGDTRGTLMNDMWAFEKDLVDYSNHTDFTRLPDTIYDLLKQRLHRDREISLTAILHTPVLVQRTVTCRGIKFSRFTTSLGDSQVIFGQYPSGDWSAGTISDIFMWPDTSGSETGETVLTPFFVVERFASLSQEE